MIKTEFIEIMSEKAGMTKKDTEIALKAFMESIEEIVENGDEINFVGFGKFGVRERAERTGRNPRTKEEIKIAACKTPYFKPGKLLKDKANK